MRGQDHGILSEAKKRKLEWEAKKRKLEWEPLSLDKLKSGVRLGCKKSKGEPQLKRRMQGR